jgi:hypothetical protein
MISKPDDAVFLISSAFVRVVLGTDFADELASRIKAIINKPIDFMIIVFPVFKSVSDLFFYRQLFRSCWRN